MVGVTVVVIVFHEKVLVSAVASKRNAGDAEAREDVPESVDSAKGAGVPPRLAGDVSIIDKQKNVKGIILSSPGVPLSINRSRRGRGLELVDVEAGGVMRHGG